MSDIYAENHQNDPHEDGFEPLIGALDILEAKNPRGYSDISTVYAYYTPEQKAEHGKHCEQWTAFGHRPEAAPYCTGGERAFIASIAGPQFSHYLISWSGCD